MFASPRVLGTNSRRSPGTHLPFDTVGGVAKPGANGALNPISYNDIRKLGRPSSFSMDRTPAEGAPRCHCKQNPARQGLNSKPRQKRVPVARPGSFTRTWPPRHRNMSDSAGGTDHRGDFLGTCCTTSQQWLGRQGIHSSSAFTGMEPDPAARKSPKWDAGRGGGFFVFSEARPPGIQGRASQEGRQRTFCQGTAGRRPSSGAWAEPSRWAPPTSGPIAPAAGDRATLAVFFRVAVPNIFAACKTCRAQPTSGSISRTLPLFLRPPVRGAFLEAFGPRMGGGGYDYFFSRFDRSAGEGGAVRARPPAKQKKMELAGQFPSKPGSTPPSPKP